MLNRQTKQIKLPAANRQFGASGGVVSCDTSQDFGSFAPVRALPIPPPALSLRHVIRHPGDPSGLHKRMIT